MADYSTEPALEELRWRDVRDAVRKVNLAFANVIDQLDPPDEFVIYKAKYPFGSTIIKDGTIFLPPRNGQQELLKNSQFAKNLAYTGGLPIGVVLNNSIELFMKPREQIIPFNLMQEGEIFALWRALDPNPAFSYHAVAAWHMTAGARSLFLLPKITDTDSYKKLSRARGLKLPTPKNLIEHAKIFAQMSCHKNFADNWQAELLFFSAAWLEKRHDSPWLAFNNFLFEYVWNNSQFWRNKMIFDFMWDSFVKEIAQENIKGVPYVIDIVKHLIMIGLGALPGFAPAINDKAGPISALKDDFIQYYGLKQYAPTIMTPCYLSLTDKRPVYWSLQFPTYFESIPKPRTSNSILTDLSNIKQVIDVFISAVARNKIQGIQTTPLEYCAKHIEFSYFHSDIAQHSEGIKHCREMINEDVNLIKCPAKYGKRKFSEISPFVRGCIRLSYPN